MFKKNPRLYTPSGDSVGVSTSYKTLTQGIKPSVNNWPKLTKLKRIVMGAGNHKTNRSPSLPEVV